jgi:hypothetical protein
MTGNFRRLWTPRGSMRRNTRDHEGSHHTPGHQRLAQPDLVGDEELVGGTFRIVETVQDIVDPATLERSQRPKRRSGDERLSKHSQPPRASPTERPPKERETPLGQDRSRSLRRPAGRVINRSTAVRRPSPARSVRIRSSRRGTSPPPGDPKRLDFRPTAQPGLSADSHRLTAVDDAADGHGCRYRLACPPGAYTPA